MFNKETLFWFCALAGSGLFLIQFFLNLFGVDAEEGEIGEEGSSHNFKWVSKQAVTGFLMMFGWAGLTCRKEFDFSQGLSIAIATLAGLVAMMVSGLIFRGAGKLRSTGTVFNLEDAIGKEAVVYQQITERGVGKVSVSLHDMTHEIDAISLNGEALPSFSKVQIVKKADDRTVVVTPYI